MNLGEAPVRANILSAADQLLVDGVLAGQRRALAKAITLIESTRPDHQQRAQQVLNALLPSTGKAIRIGVNAGSLEKDLLEKYGEPCPEALVESALDHIKLLQDRDFHEFKVAVKASDLFLAVAALIVARTGALRPPVRGAVRSAMPLSLARLAMLSNCPVRVAVRRKKR